MNNRNLVNYVDSACSCHVVGDLSLLEGRVEKVSGMSVKSVGGQMIKLTHKGSRVLNTLNATLSIKEAYYASGREYNLVSIPKLIEKGVTVSFAQSSAYMEKENTKIQFVRKGGLWAIPTMDEPRAAALRMHKNGTADAETWHNRTAHSSHQQIKEMIRQGIIPEAAAGFKQEDCEICHLTRPMRRPVPKKAERSGHATVQVDYMPIGANERGWKGEVGAYIFSSRKSKLLKVYPVQDATSVEATRALANYLTLH